MRTTVYLIRHAHSTYSTDEQARPLSEAGKKDAEQLTMLFQGTAVHGIYASPYRRAIETVQPIAEQQGLPIRETRAFQERLLAPGALEQFQEAVAYVWNHPSENPYGGESNEAAQQRVVQGMRTLLKNHQHDTLIIGTHGNIMMLLMQYFDTAYGYDKWKTLAMPAVYRLEFEGGNCLQIEEVPVVPST